MVVKKSKNESGFTSYKRVVRAFSNSIEGIISAVKSETALRQELVLFIILLPVAIATNESMVAKALMVMSLFVVIIVELINSALEAVADAVTKQQNKLIKKAKDVASAAVLVAIINAICVWGIILLT